MATKKVATSTSPRRGGRPRTSTVAKRILIGLDEKELPQFEAYREYLKSQLLKGASIADAAIAKILFMKGLEAFEKEEGRQAQPSLPLKEASTTTSKAK